MFNDDVGVGYYRVNELKAVKPEELIPLFCDENGAKVYKTSEETLVFGFAENDMESGRYICEVEIDNVLVNLLIPEKKTCFKILVLDENEANITNIIADLNAEYLHRLQLINMNLPIYLEFYMYAGIKYFPELHDSRLKSKIINS